jgi:phosphoribosyl-AMP cyclohydrolase
VTDILSHSAFVSAVKFNGDGLVPAIAQSKATGEVLMFAWMTKATLEQTLATGQVTYWSRSRQAVWKKGETSGNHQRLVEAFVDCDGDVLLLKVDQMGPACHAGAPSCFFRKLG